MFLLRHRGYNYSNYEDVFSNCTVNKQVMLGGQVCYLPNKEKCIFEIYNFGNWAGNKPALPALLANSWNVIYVS